MTVQSSRKHAAIIILLVSIFFLAGIPAVSAFTATQVSPSPGVTSLNNGDIIKIQIDGLADGNKFTYQVTSSDIQTTGDSLTQSFYMPFAFKTSSATTYLSTSGLSSGPTLYVQSSDGSATTVTGNPITKSWNIKKGNYVATISGTKAATTQSIDYFISGNVDGVPGASTFSLSLSGIQSGHLTVKILQDSGAVYTQTFVIGTPVTVAPTQNPAGAGSGGGDGGSSDGGGSGGAAGGAGGQQGGAQLAPQGNAATSVSLQHNNEGQILADYALETDPEAGFSSSLDLTHGTQVVSAAGQPVNEISITPMEPGSVPSATSGTFTFSGFSVECGPPGTQFVGDPAVISFSLTPDQWAAALAAVNGDINAMTIQTYDPVAGVWVSVPTTVDPVTHTISASVSHFSIYALFYKATTETSTTPKTIGQLAGSTTPAAGTITLAPTSAATPVKTQMAPPETTQSPALPGIAVIGTVLAVGYLVMRKKE